MKTLVPVIALAALALPQVSKGQSAELWVGGGTSMLNSKGIGSLSTTGSKDDVQLDDGFRINFRLALNTKALVGHEFGYAYNRSKLIINQTGSQSAQGMAIHQGFYNFLLYAIPEGRRVRPFATGGAHFANFVPPGSSATQGGGQTKFGFNYGFGIKARITTAWGFRLDFRQYNTGKPFDLPNAGGRLLQNEISASIGFML